MLDLFEFIETNENEDIFVQFPNLKMNNSPAFYIILRGITGNIMLKQTFRDETFVQDQDLLNPKHKSIVSNNEIEKEDMTIEPELILGLCDLLDVLKTKCKSDLNVIPRYISDTFTLQDLSEVLSNHKLIHKNKVFFDSLNNEFCNHYYHSYKSNHTVAFLHLYRILEYVSYAFPVMYASSTGDFSKSFESLKSLFTGEKDQGELKVFKYFIKNIMSVERDFERLSIEIDIVSPLEEYNERIYITIIGICDKTIFNESENKLNSKLSIKFSEFSTFIITVRNRFFHLKNSVDNNIQSIDIVDSDYFFSLLNSKCAYFISLITLEVIKKSLFQV